MGIIAGGAMYGLARGYISGALMKYVPNFLGEWTDEAVMLAANYYIAKKVSNPTIKNAAKAGLAIESAVVGRMLASKFMGGGLTTTANSQVVHS